MNTFKQVGPRQPPQTDETPTGLCRWHFRHLHLPLEPDAPVWAALPEAAGYA